MEMMQNSFCKIYYFLLLIIFSCLYASDLLEDKVGPVINESHINKIRKFVIVTASYNNIDCVDKYLESVFSQKCDENEFTFRVVYCDDGSTDGTYEAVDAYKKRNNLGDKFCIIRNSVKVGAHENIYNTVHSCDDDEIVLIVDGDDCLARNDVLDILNKIYSDQDVWLTYGQFKKYPGGEIGCCSEIPEEVIKSNSFRKYKWVSSHLRTFYVWLYKRIKKEDIMFEGKFVPFGGDLAIMFPMLEMAGVHSRFIPEVLYIYNSINVNSYWYNLVKNRKKVKEIAKASRVGQQTDYRSKKISKKASNKAEEAIKNALKESEKIRSLIGWHIRNEITPYSPLESSDLSNN